MKVLLVAICLVCAAFAHTEVTVLMNEKTSIDTVFGFLEGMVSTAFGKTLPDITPCLKDAQPMADDLDDAVHQFMTGKAGIVPGLEKLGDMLTKLAPLILDCKQCPAEIKQGILTLKADFTNKAFIKKMIMNALFHLEDLFNDIKLVVADAKAKNFVQMGSDMGKLIQVLEVETELYSLHSINEDVSQLLKGLFLTAFNTSIPDVSNCITDAAGIEAAFKNVVSDFSHHSFIQGFKDLILAFKEIPTVIAPCKSIPAEAIAEVKAMKDHITDLSRDKSVVEDILFHHMMDVFEDVSAIKADYEKHEYFQLGSDIGKVLILFKLP
jgi:hypothetical protein